MRQIEWSMWANEQALTSALLTFIGGVMGITQVFKNWGFGLYGIIISILVGLFEYPRSKRMKGTTNERMYQRFITVALSKLGFFSQNYFIRFILYILIGVPCCFQLPIVLGGICFFCTSIIYFVAAMKGESWKPAGLEKPDRQGSQVVAGVVSNPPPIPPPRLPEDVAQSVLQRQMSGRRI